MDTSRLMHSLFQHLPDFFKRKLSPKEKYLFSSMTNISQINEENFIYDNDGYLLFMQTTQSNLSLFNVSCDSLIFNENKQSKLLMKYSNSSFNLQNSHTKNSEYRSTIFFSEDIFSSKTNTLQRWQGVELLNTYA